VVGSRHWRYRLNSSSWSVDGSPDRLVWTDTRTVRRIRLARVLPALIAGFTLVAAAAAVVLAVR
jgi:hypothetical protein